MNILMATSECLPYSKTGGLGDVAYSLSKEFVKKGHNVLVVSPLYKKKFDFEKNHVTFIYSFPVKMSWREQNANVLYCLHDGIDYFFIENDYYFTRDGGLYGFYDDGERFAFFSNAVIELIKHLPFRIDICHVHDWQGGMIPCILKNLYQNDQVLGKIRTVLTIHNPLFKGYLSRESLGDLYNLPLWLYDNGSVRFDNQVSTLKAGIKFADKITTVSPTHAFELTTVEGSKGLWYDLVLRQNDFVGILNGMDYKEFDPSKDNSIYHKYNVKNCLTDKKINKEIFANQHGLDQNKPLFAVVSRLTDQKGLDLIYAMAEHLIGNGGTFAVLGSGEYDAEQMFNDLYARHPNDTFVYIGYSDDIAHKLYASSDFFIMPSAFEPCGLGQMIAHRYGSLPLVRRTGGLKDSVICYDKERKNQDVANGFGFDDYNQDAARWCVDLALDTFFNHKKVFNELVHNAMKTDHTWDKSADKYLELYELVLSYNN